MIRPDPTLSTAAHPPTESDVQAAQQDVRVAAEHTYRVAADQMPRSVERLARRTADKRGLIAIAFAAAVALAVALVFAPIAAGARADASTATADAAAAKAAALTAQQTAEAAKEQIVDANKVLTGRGQQPVLTPPDSADSSDLLAAAVLAKVLAQLPAVPTIDQVASRLQSAITANVLGVTSGQVSAQAAAYLATLTPPGPTQAQVDAAMAKAYAANPPKDGAPGPIGPKGGQGDPCLPSDPACVGAKGDRGDAGEPGRSVLDQQFVRLDDLSCVSRVTYSSEPLVVDRPAGDAACPPAPILPDP